MQNFFSQLLGGGGSSLSSLQKKATENPKSATAWRNLATKLEQDQKTDARDHRARALHRAEAQGRERAPGARRPLPAPRPGLQRRLVGQWPRSSRSSRRARSSGPTRPRPLGKAFANQDPITKVVSAGAEHQGERGVAEARRVHGKAQSTYKRLVKLAPAERHVPVPAREPGARASDATTSRRRPTRRS